MYYFIITILYSYIKIMHIDFVLFLRRYIKRIAFLTHRKGAPCTYDVAHLVTTLSSSCGNVLVAGEAVYAVKDSVARRIWKATFSVQGGQRAGRTGDIFILSQIQSRPEGITNLTGLSLHPIQRPHLMQRFYACLHQLRSK